MPLSEAFDITKKVGANLRVTGIVWSFHGNYLTLIVPRESKSGYQREAIKILLTDKLKRLGLFEGDFVTFSGTVQKVNRDYFLNPIELTTPVL